MRMIIPLVQKHCINGISKEDAINIKDIPVIEEVLGSFNERITELEQGGSGEYILFDDYNWSDLFDRNGIALYDIKILINVPIYSDQSTLRSYKLEVVEIIKGLEYSQQIIIDGFDCYSPYNVDTGGLFIAYNFYIPDGLFFNDTETGIGEIYYYKHYNGENPSWYNADVTFTKKTRFPSSLMQSGEVYLMVKNYNPNPVPR